VQHRRPPDPDRSGDGGAAAYASHAWCSRSEERPQHDLGLSPGPEHERAPAGPRASDERLVPVFPRVGGGFHRDRHEFPVGERRIGTRRGEHQDVRERPGQDTLPAVGHARRPPASATTRPRLPPGLHRLRVEARFNGSGKIKTFGAACETRARVGSECGCLEHRAPSRSARPAFAVRSGDATPADADA